MLSPSLQHRLSLQQKLSPQQIQYQKLLQLNTLSLEQRIKTELELNPILEEDYELTQEQLEDSADDSGETTSSDDDDAYDKKQDEFELEDYMNEVDHDVDKMNRSNDEERLHPIAPSRKTLRESLFDQLYMLNLSENETTLGEYIIDSLDKDGYFKQDITKIMDDLRLFEDIEFSREHAEKILQAIQLMEPSGIAARSLQECLLFQIRNSSFDPYYSFIAEKILSLHWDNFTNKRFDVIEKELNLTRETLKTANDIIQKLNPKPGEGNIDSEEANQVTPIFSLKKLTTILLLL